VNVYDFDGTIYRGDSSIDFYIYCLKRQPGIVRYALSQLLALGLYLTGFYSKEKWKSVFFSFMKALKEPDAAISGFWLSHKRKISDFYLKQKSPDDVIISASPEFLLEPICAELGAMRLIASRVDARSGKWLGKNCYGEEKAVRFREVFPDAEIERFYSDSRADAPMADLAREGFIARRGAITPWNEYKPGAFQKLRDTFFTRKFISFVFCGASGSLTNIIVSSTVSLFLDPTVSYLFGYAAGLTITYPIAGKLMFGMRLCELSIRRYGKFAVSYLPNFCILMTFVAVFINVLGWYHILVYGLAAIVAIPITFMLIKIFAFGDKNKKEDGGRETA
jgi:phosphoserine phosphatase/putative flippase GtrA